MSDLKERKRDKIWRLLHHPKTKEAATTSGRTSTKASTPQGSDTSNVSSSSAAVASGSSVPQPVVDQPVVEQQGVKSTDSSAKGSHLHSPVAVVTGSSIPQPAVQAPAAASTDSSVKASSPRDPCASNVMSSLVTDSSGASVLQPIVQAQGPKSTNSSAHASLFQEQDALNSSSAAISTGSPASQPVSSVGTVTGPSVSQPAVPAQSADDISTLRNALWQKAYQKLCKDSPELMQAYDLLAKNSAQIDSKSFTDGEIAAVAKKQKEQMENRQWTYPWFGKSKKVRETVDSILKVVTQASGLISAGMTFAPPYVSIPWSFISILIPFILSDFQIMEEAIDGLKEVTSVLASYSYAEEEYLGDDVTKDKYGSTVMNLYMSVFHYQASVALYFAKGTLKRLGYTFTDEPSWKDSLQTVRNESNKCNPSLQALGVALTRHDISTLPDVLKDVTQKGFQLMASAVQGAVAESRRREHILDWLYPRKDVMNHHLDVRKLLGDEYYGSGRWLMEKNSSFQTWRMSENGVLLLQGIVGTGKSSLTSIVIQDFLQNAHETFAFFYCSASASRSSDLKTSRSDPASILRSLLAQCAILPDGSIASSIQDAFGDGDRSYLGECDIDTLEEALLERPGRQITFIIDALDECSKQDDLLSSLVKLLKRKANLRIFISSRVRKDLPNYFPGSHPVRVDSHNSVDIHDYIEKEISKPANEKRLTPDHQKRLITALERLSEGMFRWVVLEISLFLPPPNSQGSNPQSQDIEKRLVNLEKSEVPLIKRLEGAYEEIYYLALGEKDAEVQRAMVKGAIKWALCALQPVLAAEIALALLFRTSSKGYGNEGSTITDERQIGDDQSESDVVYQFSLEQVASFRADMMGYCNNLLVESNTGHVKLAHLSVRHFFEGPLGQEFSRPQQHLEVALTCVPVWCTPVRLLIAKPFHINNEDQKEVERSYVQYKPVDLAGIADRFLQDYVDGNWSLHARIAVESAELKGLLSSRKTKDRIGRPLEMLHLEIATKTDLSTQDMLGDTKLHRASRLNLDDHVSLLLRADLLSEDSRLVKLKNSAGDAPIHVAAVHGLEKIFQRLYSADFSMQKNSYGVTPLQLAVLFDQRDIVQRAIGMGLDLQQSDSYENSLLHYAMFFGRDSIVQILLAAGLHVDRINKEGKTALDFAQDNQQWHILERTTDPYLETPSQLMHRPTQEEMAENGTEFNHPQLRTFQVRLDDKTVSSCKNCDLETWIEGSTRHLQYVVTVSGLLEGYSQGCQICKELLKRTQPEQEDSFSHEDAKDTEELRVWVSLDFHSKFKEGRDLLYVSRSGKVFATFEFCIDSKDKTYSLEQYLFVGRVISPNSREYNAMERIKHWLAECRIDHDICGQSEDRIPTRLIDLGDPAQHIKPRLIITKDHQKISGGYVFLSYLWGSSSFRTLKELDLVHFVEELPTDELARVHKDAIRACRRLGYQYLWIDALCIVQDDYHDWALESSLIASYASSADIVFAATAQNAHGSLFPQSGVDENQNLTLIARMENDNRGAFILTLRQPVQTAAAAIREVLNRAWRIQEVYLARRIVVFGREQVYWNCGRVLRSESSTKEIPPAIQGVSSLSMSLESPRSFGGTRSSRFIYESWYKLAEIVSSGKLTHEEDRRLSIAGLAKSYQTILPAKYLEGLWGQDFAHGLLWLNNKEIGLQQAVINSQGGRPTITWPSNRGPISYAFATGLKAEQALKFPAGFIVIEVQTYAMDRLDSLVVSALCRPLHISSLTEVIQYFFDDVSNSLDTLEEWKGFWLLIVAPWVCKLGTKAHSCRWVGLILQEMSEVATYQRRGVFVGPDTTAALDGWKQCELRII